MKKISLNYRQISELINQHKISLENNETIEIFDKEIVYNSNGIISYLKIADMIFKEQEPSDDFLQNLICDHFNLSHNNVICTSISNDDFTFRVRFSPKKELEIIVIPINIAIKNTEELYEKTIEKYYNANQIGVYRRLSNSCYFYRWNEEN